VRNFVKKKQNKKTLSQSLSGTVNYGLARWKNAELTFWLYWLFFCINVDQFFNWPNIALVTPFHTLFFNKTMLLMIQLYFLMPKNAQFTQADLASNYSNILKPVFLSTTSQSSMIRQSLRYLMVMVLSIYLLTALLHPQNYVHVSREHRMCVYPRVDRTAGHQWSRLNPYHANNGLNGRLERRNGGCNSTISCSLSLHPCFNNVILPSGRQFIDIERFVSSGNHTWLIPLSTLIFVSCFCSKTFYTPCYIYKYVECSCE